MQLIASISRHRPVCRSIAFALNGDGVSDQPVAISSDGGPGLAHDNQPAPRFDHLKDPGQLASAVYKPGTRRNCYVSLALQYLSHFSLPISLLCIQLREHLHDAPSSMGESEPKPPLPTARSDYGRDRVRWQDDDAEMNRVGRRSLENSAQGRPRSRSRGSMSIRRANSGVDPSAALPIQYRTM